ncbi:thiol-disulfide oxidoreductase DCC family protein [Ruegeria profundi]|uniref:thiol-disulfide oxidoreductase DCC family protein n=1 Tax=Ruegeria profundi TaxID=1685378 RepID=UPI001CD5D40B|nr:DUF393 domain-containing protein [Ruegeria profundi]MCA0928298.1 DUF393 domain-containing protein [Ruegeria profundi]
MPKDDDQAVQKQNTCGANDTAPQRATVYFDGSCPLCSLEIGHYASCEGADGLRFVDVSDPDAQLAEGLSQDKAMARFHVQLPDGTLVSGANGFVAVWRALPKWRWLARVAQLPGAVQVMEFAYRMFLPLRPMLSRIASRLGAKPKKHSDTTV